MTLIKRVTQQIVDRTIINIAARTMNLEIFAEEGDKILRKKLGIPESEAQKTALLTDDAKIADGENGRYKVERE